VVDNSCISKTKPANSGISSTWGGEVLGTSYAGITEIDNSTARSVVPEAVFAWTLTPSADLTLNYG
jgi:hypothetical protein